MREIIICCPNIFYLILLKTLRCPKVGVARGRGQGHDSYYRELCYAGLVIEINTTNIQKYSANQFKNLFTGENLLHFSFSEISLDSVLEIWYGTFSVENNKWVRQMRWPVSPILPHYCINIKENRENFPSSTKEHLENHFFLICKCATVTKKGNI